MNTKEASAVKRTADLLAEDLEREEFIAHQMDQQKEDQKLYREHRSDEEKKSIVCRCGHNLEDHSAIGCDRFVVKHKPGKPKNVVKVDFCSCNLKVNDLLKLE